MATDGARASGNDWGWLGTGTFTTPIGALEFAGGYPTEVTTQRLTRMLTVNRAIEAYLAQMPVVSWYAVWKGVAAAGNAVANQLVIWESLMDAQTLLLTGNTETVYGLAAIDLKRDGPVVVDVPPMMLGGASDLWQAEIVGIGPTGADKGKGGKVLFLPPGFTGAIPDGFIIAKSPTFRVVLGLRGFQVEGKTDKPVALMKQTRIYPLASAAAPPAMIFVNGSGQPINTIFSDTTAYFDDLAEILNTEPDRLSSQELFQLAAIGIEKGKPFTPDADRKALLEDTVRLASAVARANTYASADPARLIYPDRRWEWLFIGGSATWDAQGFVNTDRRAGFAYAAIGMSPAMVEKVVGAGSQYYFVTRDATGAWLEGGKAYRLHLPPNIPVKNFWSVVVYDAESRSMLQNGDRFPSLSQYTGPVANADGSVDIYFGPLAPAGKERNWIRTVEGKGWFPLIRFYGPLQPLFDQSWKPDDIVAIA